MKTAAWESSAGALAALLNTGQPVWADLFTFTLLGGLVLRYTSADVPQPLNGNTWAIGPQITRSGTKVSIGVNVDDQQLTVAAASSVQVNGKPLMAFIAAGGLDGARYRLERLFKASWTAPPTGTLLMFTGRLSETKMSRYEAQITVRSDLELLDAKVPRNLYQPGCMNTLYDEACGLNRTALTVSNAVAASPAPTRWLFGSTLGQAAAYFDLGVVSFTSGANAGVARTVRSFAAGGQVQVIAPLPFAPAAGDTFSIYPGCDKTQATCTSRFANLARFRGAPYVPVPETVT